MVALLQNLSMKARGYNLNVVQIINAAAPINWRLVVKLVHSACARCLCGSGERGFPCLHSFYQFARKTPYFSAGMNSAASIEVLLVC